MTTDSKRFDYSGRALNVDIAIHVATVFETDSGELLVPPLFTVLSGRELELYRSERGNFAQVPSSVGYFEEISLARARAMFDAGIQHVAREEAFPGEAVSQLP